MTRTGSCTKLKELAPPVFDNVHQATALFDHLEVGKMKLEVHCIFQMFIKDKEPAEVVY